MLSADFFRILDNIFSIFVEIEEKCGILYK